MGLNLVIDDACKVDRAGQATVDNLLCVDQVISMAILGIKVETKFCYKLVFVPGEETQCMEKRYMNHPYRQCLLIHSYQT
jgi:hypothetical protein